MAGVLDTDVPTSVSPAIMAQAVRAGVTKRGPLVVNVIRGDDEFVAQVDLAKVSAAQAEGLGGGGASAAGAAWKELADAVKPIGRPAATPVREAVSEAKPGVDPCGPQVLPPDKAVTFVMANGEMEAFYHDVHVGESSLVLIYDTRFRGPRFCPRPSSEQLAVMVGGSDLALLACATPHQFLYGHQHFCVLEVLKKKSISAYDNALHEAVVGVVAEGMTHDDQRSSGGPGTHPGGEDTGGDEDPQVF